MAGQTGGSLLASTDGSFLASAEDSADSGYSYLWSPSGQTGLLGSFDQCSVGEFFPSMRPGLFDGVADETTGQAARCAIVKKNAREPAG